MKNNGELWFIASVLVGMMMYTPSNPLVVLVIPLWFLIGYFRGETDPMDTG